MAKLVTTVRTYFKNGTYRNNTIEINIPDEAAKLIKKEWCDELGVGNYTTAKFLASNQMGLCFLEMPGEPQLGIQNMPREDTQREEVFEQHFKDEEDD